MLGANRRDDSFWWFLSREEYVGVRNVVIGMLHQEDDQTVWTTASEKIRKVTIDGGRRYKLVRKIPHLPFSISKRACSGVAAEIISNPFSRRTDS